MAERVLIIGLDGATWTVLEPLIQDGELPAIASLKTDGVWGELRSTIPPLSAPAWASFMTGKNPSRHGVFHFRRSGSDTEIVNGRDIDSATLWDVLGHQGRRVGVMNMPMSYPPRPVNGFVVTGLLTPPDADVFTYPPDLSAELGEYQIDLDRFMGQKPFAASEDGVRAKREVKPDLQLMEEFHSMEDRRGRTALSLMGSREWDVFAVVFTATDRMGHYLWPHHPGAEHVAGEEAAELRDAVRRFYRMVDEWIGRLVDAAGPRTTTILASDHGMGPMYTKHAHWNAWLYDRGYLDIDSASRWTPDGLLLRFGISRDRLRRVASRLPGLSGSGLARKVKSAPTASVDRSRSKVEYDRIFDPVGGFWIHSDEDRDRIRRELLAELPKVVDPHSGMPIVAEVMTREECYDGPYSRHAPDVIIVMRPEYGSSNRLSNYSAVVTERAAVGDPGSHRMEGIFVMGGEGIPAMVEPVAGLAIEDVAPTVLHALGLGVPSDMDGRVHRDLFSDPSIRDREPTIIDPPGRWPSEQEAGEALADTVESDEEAVRERLRALGYFG